MAQARRFRRRVSTVVPFPVAQPRALDVSAPSKYPYAIGDRLLGTNLSHDFSSDAGPLPPTSPHGNATLGKLWLDTSLNPPVLRICAVATAQNGYVPSDWMMLGQVTGGGVAAGYNLRVVTAGGNVVLAPPTTYLSMRQSVSSPVNITLPPNVSAGYPMLIKDSLGVCSFNPYTINTADGSLIDGQPGFVFAASFQSQLFVFDGNWWGVNG